MTRAGAANVVLSALALAASSAAILLHYLDRPPSPVAPAPVDRPVEAPSEPTAEVAARCLPGVVNISSTRLVRDPGAGNPFFDVFRRFFGLGEGPPQEAQSLGSGVIVGADGVVLTNHHVVAGATDIRVTLSDGRELPARLVGSDPQSDVAVMRIVGDDLALQPLPYGDSSTLRQGDVVLAIGNPFGVGQTVTMGIVSAVGRSSVGITDYEDFIQTDAAINPGNSGGALVSLRGELVGINTAILSRTGGSHGIGFAIPSNMARPVAEALLRTGRVTRGWIGASLADLTPELAASLGLRASRGVVVTDVLPHGPAARGGLSRGDLIARLDSESIASSRQLRNLIATRGAGTAVRLTRVREGESAEIRLTLSERPPEDPVDATDPAVLAGAVDVAGLLVRPLTGELRRQLGVAGDVVRGVVIVGAREGSAAARSEVRPGDVVVEVDGAQVASPEQLREAVGRAVFVAMLRVRRGVESRIVLLPR